MHMTRYYTKENCAKNKARSALVVARARAKARFSMQMMNDAARLAMCFGGRRRRALRLAAGGVNSAEFNLAAHARSRRTEVGVCPLLYQCVLVDFYLRTARRDDRRFAHHRGEESKSPSIDDARCGSRIER